MHGWRAGWPKGNSAPRTQTEAAPPGLTGPIGGTSADTLAPHATRAFRQYARAFGIALPHGLNRLEASRRSIVRLGRLR